MFVGVENGCQVRLIISVGALPSGKSSKRLAPIRPRESSVATTCLLFEPDVALADVRENIDFIRRHAHIPVNFCRAEPYHGTPLYERVKQRSTLLGSYLGWDYRIDDDRAELAFRIAAAVFRERNFNCQGVANRTMGLGYTAHCCGHSTM